MNVSLRPNLTLRRMEDLDAEETVQCRADDRGTEARGGRRSGGGGESGRLGSVEISDTKRLQDLLTHLYVLIQFLDNEVANLAISTSS